jgi:hypothetical protein
LQSSAIPALQVPAWQVSAPLQALPSAHDVPFATAGYWQPDAGLQVSLVHGLPSVQTSGVPAPHVPPWQVSAPLHAFPSPHDVPFDSGVYTHPPEALHESAVHGLLSVQVSGAPAVHVPDWHVSAPLQTFESAHDVPFATAGY